MWAFLLLSTVRVGLFLQASWIYIGMEDVYVEDSKNKCAKFNVLLRVIYGKRFFLSHIPRAL